MKARMRSIYDALDLIKQKAQDTALTYNSIINLCLTDKIDYIRAHKNQMAVGSLGEEIVYNFEKEKLTKLGLKDKAKEVKAVSGDSTLGYDILSFNENGDEIHIEVKSKSGNISYLDFYISDNEYEKLNANENHFVYYI